MNKEDNNEKIILERYDIVFVNPDGNIIAEESIKTHTEFDGIFAKKNPKLIKRFEVSGYTNLTLYLICEEGYMQAGQIGGYKGLIYNSAKVTKAQRIIKEKFEKMGYDVEDLAPEAEVDER